MINKMLMGLMFLGLMASMVIAEEEFKPSFNNKGSRIALGYYDSGKDGSYKYGSVVAPDAKLRFNWNMSLNVTIVTRMSLKNATFDSLDYFYADYNNLLTEIAPSLKDSAFNPLFRIGRMKIDFGEETFADNPVEGALVSNSAGIASGYDEGLQFSQMLHKEVLGIPFKWSIGMTSGNDNSGTTKSADSNQAKALFIKVGACPIPELYISVSNYNTNDMRGADKAEFSYGGLTSAPTNATNTWKRQMSELDIRYDIQPGNENRLNPGAPAWTDSKAYIRVAFGSFNDTGTGTLTVTARKGSYYFLEGLYNATEKIYLAARLSTISFSDSDEYEKLNSLAIGCNKYDRTSIGVGYRLTNNSQVKIENATNSADVKAPVQKPEINQTSIVFTNKF